MSEKVKILAFAGSTRKESYNRKLLANAVEIAEELNAEVTVVDLKELALPLYDGDYETENGIPENGIKFMNMLIEHDGFMISSPEYNSSFSGVLKNAIDWASRPVKGLKPLAAFDGKTALLMSASTGTLGGLRGLHSLRMMLMNIKTLVIPYHLALSKASHAFDENGNLAEEKQKEILQNSIKKFLWVVKALKEAD